MVRWWNLDTPEVDAAFIAYHDRLQGTQWNAALIAALHAAFAQWTFRSDGHLLRKSHA